MMAATVIGVTRSIGMKKATYFLVGIALLPLVPGFGLHFYSLLVDIRFGFDIHPALVYGFATYAVIHILLHKPIMTYAFAHEFTHALWALFFGGKLKEFRVGPQGGHAVVTKSNLWVAIAPYFFPLYAYLVLGVHLLCVFTSSQEISGFVTRYLMRSRILPYTCFFTGTGIAFHLLFTFHSLLKRQSDLKKGGVLLSLVLIFLLNIVFILLGFKLLDPGRIEFVQFLKSSAGWSVSLVLSTLNI